MSAASSSRGSLEALAKLRERTREEAETFLASAVAAERLAVDRLASAERERREHATRAAVELAEARSTAKSGGDWGAIESMARAGRDDAMRLSVHLTECQRRRDEASLEVTRARAGLARSEADEKAVRGRLEAIVQSERLAAIAREDDEADERSQSRRG